jgi:hypothetical protein
MVKDALSPQAQNAAFAEYSRQQVEEQQAANRAVLGGPSAYVLTVDGRRNAAFETIKISSTVVATYDLLLTLLQWIATELERHSPVARGRDPAPNVTYSRSHKLYADGSEVAPGAIPPPAELYIFANDVPYARKIESGSSTQAPDGVYQAVALLAKRRFGFARIFFTFVTVGAQRQPAISVRST